MRIVFMGTPDFSVPCLQALIDDGHDVCAVFTQPDKPKGRHGILTQPPVKELALKYNIPVYQPKTLRTDEAKELFKSLDAELAIVVAYGKILPDELLHTPKYGCINMHASLLPKLRGAAPIQWAVITGEKRTGVTSMQMDAGIDTGDMLLALKTEIGAAETYGELSERLSLLGAEAVVKALPLIESGNYTLKKQDGARASVVRKITKEQAKIDFSRSADEIVNLVRGMNPEPAAFSFLGELRLNVYRAEAASRPEGTENAREGEILSDGPKQGFLVACKGGAVKLTEVQAAGGKRMRGADFLNGRKAEKGQVFSC